MILCRTTFARDLELSWDKGLAFLPGAFLPTSPQKISVDLKHPVVIYLHGCAGIDYNHDTRWAKDISRHGFIVILPDSMARPDRISNCDPSRHRATGAFPKAYGYRQHEIAYALDRIREAPWADQNNLFLMGHSEGGIATAHSTHDVWNAQVISGWSCSHTLVPYFNGIHSAASTPVLAVAFVEDIWRKGKPTEGRCIDKAPDHKVIQIDLPGSEHNTYHATEARRQVIDFLKSHVKP